MRAYGLRHLCLTRVFLMAARFRCGSQGGLCPELTGVAGIMSEQQGKSAAIDDLPVDELVAYGRTLGMHLNANAGRGELLRLVRERQALLAELEHEALLDIVVWARRPVRQSAGKEELAKEIASVKRVDFQGLSDRGLVALARLRGVPVSPKQPRKELEKAVRASEPFWDKITRKRRRLIGSLISHLLDDAEPESKEAYRFLPEESGHTSLKERIAEQGVVSGLARTIRGVADDYVRQKMDEIEARIDRKLDEIDRRLAEWRDREIANRLKIIKITLVASILVALMSYGYTLLKSNIKPVPAGVEGIPVSAPAGGALTRPAEAD